MKLDYEKIFRIPYSTGPHFEIYNGPLYDITKPYVARFTEGEIEWMIRHSDLYHSYDNYLNKAALEALKIHEDIFPVYGYSTKEPLLKRLNYLLGKDIAIVKNGRLENYCILFPTNWIPRKKQSKTFAEIHCPVPGVELQKASDKICRMLSKNKNYHRYAWTLTRNPRLSAHPVYEQNNAAACRAQLAHPDYPLYVRIEHQITFPISTEKDEAFGFLIEVQSVPVSVIKYEGSFGLLQTACKTMTKDVIVYKGIEEHIKTIVNNKTF